MAKQSEGGLKLPIYDIRLLERNLRLGIIDRKEYEAYIKKLTDEESNAEYVEIVDETTEDVKPEGGNAGEDPEQLTFT